jgi:hypothetical protein
MAIYKNTDPGFEKVSMSYRLGDNPKTWLNELTAYLFRQHPYLAVTSTVCSS